MNTCNTPLDLAHPTKRYRVRIHHRWHALASYTCPRCRSKHRIMEPLPSSFTCTKEQAPDLATPYLIRQAQALGAIAALVTNDQELEQFADYWKTITDYEGRS